MQARISGGLVPGCERWKPREPVTIVDLLSTDEGADIEFEPERLGLAARTPEL